MIIITILITRDNFNSLHWITDRMYDSNDFIANFDINDLYNLNSGSQDKSLSRLLTVFNIINTFLPFVLKVIKMFNLVIIIRTYR